MRLGQSAAGAVSLVFAIVLAILPAGIASAAEKKATLASGGSGAFQFPSPDSSWQDRNHDLIGTVELPAGGTEPWPAIILFHGSSGPGYRSESWGAFFRQNGIATMRVDYFTTRGLKRAGRGGPVSPGDVTGAIRFLATHPDIDKTRIGVMGFSRGGSMVLLARRYSLSRTGNVHPAVFVALYAPGCRRISIGASEPDAPLLIVTGSADALINPAPCKRLQQEGRKAGKPVRTLVLPGGTHAFDDNRARVVKIRGRKVPITPNAQLTAIARQEVLKTVKAAFGM